MQLLSIIDVISLSYNSILANGQAKQAFVIIEYICVTWFTIELITRFILSPVKLKFIKYAFNIIILFSIIPFFIHLGFSSNSFIWRFDIFSRVLRIVTALKIFSDFDKLKAIGNTLTKSKVEILVYCCFLSAGSLIFATLLWLCEFENANTKYTDIPASLWWAVIHC